MTALLWTLAFVLVVTGLVGSVVPALPGAVLVLAGLVVGAWADGFERVGWPTLLLLAALSGLVYLVDFLATAYGTKRIGASRRSIYGAALGALVGLFFGLPGLILGPFVGAALGELSLRRDLRLAGKAGLGAWLGLLLGTLAKVALLFVMLGVFVMSFVY